MKVGKLNGDLRVQREEDLLPSCEIGLGGSNVGSREGSVGSLGLEGAVRLVEALHHGDELVLAELDLDDTLGLEHTGTRLLIGVHLHHAVGVDGGVEDDPRATSELSVGDDVDEGGLLVRGEAVDDERSPA